jgi:uncharacterized lipoprotein YbaY
MPLSDGTGEIKVAGEIIFDSRPPEGAEATLIVRIEDVSSLDAPSRVIAERRVETVPLRGAGASLPFEISVPRAAVQQQRQYSVRVHLDLSGSGEVSRGDFVSTQSHPVLTENSGTLVQVPVRQV